MLSRVRASWAVKVALLALLPCAAMAASEEESLQELRGTVINLLQTLVEQGVITREKAAALVKAAQDKAAADAAATAKEEQGAVRVPYIPQVVKDEISKQLAEELRPSVVNDVLANARDQRWGVPGAMPEWLGRIRLFGDVTFRNQADLFDHGNADNAYLDFNAVNSKGGIIKAGPAAFVNTTQNIDRLRIRGRLGAEATLGPDFTAGFRVVSGGVNDPASAFSTLGNYDQRYTAALDEIYVRLDERTATEFPWLSVVGGRMLSPWFTPTDLVYHRDLTFEGLAATARVGVGDGSKNQSRLFLTLGALPVQSVLSANKAKDKWMLGGQLGGNLEWDEGERFTFGFAYFDYSNVAGQKNSPESTLTDWSAPTFVRVGNSMFDIRNTTDLTQNLFALAAQFRLADVAVTYDLPIGGHSLSVAAEAVRNVGYNVAEIYRRTGLTIPARTKGYDAELGFGTPLVDALGTWRTRIGYRYVQRDAVLDAFTESDFREVGGTDVAGYYSITDIGLSRQLWLRLRYLAGHEIDGPPFAVETIQFDVNARF